MKAGRLGGRLALWALCLLVPASATAEAPPACVVSGRPASMEVEVRPEGAATFSLRLRGIAVSVRPPPASGQPAALEVAAPLRFSAVARAVPYVIREPLDAASGMLRLTPQAALSDVRGRGPEVVLTARLAPWSSSGVTARQLALPCAALGIGEPPGPPAAPPPGPKGAALSLLRPRFTLRGRPGGGEALTLLAESTDSLRLSPLARQAGWTQVSKRWADGSQVRGWIPAAELAARPWATEGTRPGPLPRGCGQGKARDRRTVTLGPGTRVYAQPGRGPWARAEGNVRVEVEGNPADPWLPLVRVDGLSAALSCDALDHAWVPRRDVAPRPE